MMFLLYILVFCFHLYFNRSQYCQADSWKLTLDGQQKLMEYQYRLGQSLMGWNLHCSFKPELKKYKRILVVANHMNYLDGFLVSKYLAEQFPSHFIHPVSRGDIQIIPFFGQLVNSNCICLNRDFETDQQIITDKIIEIKSEDLSIVLIFPEGTNRCPETQQSCLDFCQTRNIKPFKHLLSPRPKGIQLINNLYQPDLVLDLTIFYPDDYLNYKAQYVTDLVFNIIPREAVIITSPINSLDSKSKSKSNDELEKPKGDEDSIGNLMKMWYQKDAFFNKLIDLESV